MLPRCVLLQTWRTQGNAEQGSVLSRVACVLQAAMTHVLAGVQLGLRGRPDAAWFVQQEQEALESVQQLLPK